MNPLSPEPPGSEYIHIHTDGNAFHIKYDCRVRTMADFFYCALSEIPFGYAAMLMAIDKFKQDKNETQQDTFS